MVTLVQFSILGLGLGAAYALLSVGLIVIYRGSGVLNFAQGAFAMVGAFVYYECSVQHQLGTPLSLTLAIASGTVLGLLTHLLVMRPLQTASPLARLTATLGVLAILEGAATIRYKDNAEQVNSFLPQKVIHWGSLSFPLDRVVLFGIAVVVTLGIWAISRYSSIGVGMRAVAENQTAAAAIGWSPNLIACVTWSLGGGLAALAGVLIAPQAGLNVTNLTLIVIAAMAAGLFAGFSGFILALIAASLIGTAQSLLVRYVHIIGVSQAVPFIVIVLVLVAFGRSLPLRSHVLERLPRIGPARVRPTRVLPIAAVAVVLLVFVASNQLSAAVTTQVSFAVVLLSVVLVTGYAGQLSLAPMAFAGVGAFVAMRFVIDAGLPLTFALPLGVIGAGFVGLLLGLPALRTRGVNLAVVTLGLGLAVDQVLFNRLNGAAKTAVGPAHFIFNVDPINHPGRYAAFTIVMFVLVVFAMANIRRGRSGRRLIAVRTNERAAASVGTSVFGAKLVAFGLSAAVAGLGGILIGFSSYNVTFDGFGSLASIAAITAVTVGGVGYMRGSIVGSCFAAGGVVSYLINKLGNIDEWLVLASGVAVVLTLIQHPDGLVDSIARARVWSSRRKADPRDRSPSAPQLAVVGDAARATPKELVVDGVSVHYGGVVAVNGLSVTVAPGEVVGLIGPNGSGKTTFVDAVTGFAKLASGTVTLDGVRLDGAGPHKRVRAGLGRSFQSVELFDDLTVAENLQAACDDHSPWAYLTDIVHPRVDPLSGGAQRALREFGLTEQLQEPVSSLSFGQRRLVSIARSVATGPSVLLLDEPAAGLDDVESAELSRLIRSLAAEWGMAVILIEHDMNVIMNSCDRIVVLNSGEMLAQGTPEQIRSNVDVIAAYLGEPTAAADETPANAASRDTLSTDIASSSPS